jgi:hypothetical protein
MSNLEKHLAWNFHFRKIPNENLTQSEKWDIHHEGCDDKEMLWGREMEVKLQKQTAGRDAAADSIV